jgi:uncharacterized membrane protein YecN with MAPEG domain
MQTMAPLAPVALVTVLAAGLMILTALNVARMRIRHRIDAPRMTGHPDLEVALRIQANTLEMGVPFLAALWPFAAFVSVQWAAILGFVWLAARTGYAIGYSIHPKHREYGFIVSFLATSALIFGALWGTVRAFIG